MISYQSLLLSTIVLNKYYIVLNDTKYITFTLKAGARNGPLQHGEELGAQFLLWKILKQLAVSSKRT